MLEAKRTRPVDLMANFVRRIVSGNKARFKDAHLDIELDLVYVTDHIIIMGFPATGVEGLYRNHRDDAKRFLEHRHGKNYWVFNFCPLRENSYPASLFDGRVSRYPFPDHHAPPLAILPLAVREMRSWLSGSSDRVIVLHCKAGKGRSGTLACAYLLSLDEAPSPPKLERSFDKKELEWVRRRVDQIAQIVETEDMETEAKDSANTVRTSPDSMQSVGGASSYGSDSNSDKHSECLITQAPTTAATDKVLTESPTTLSPVSTSIVDPQSVHASNETKHKSKTTLEDVIALHTSRRMKAPTAPNKKLKQGVSIPSQRRWLFYWSLILSGAAPPDFWSISDPPSTRPKPRVRLRQITIRMRELGGVKMNLLRVADKLIERSNGSKSSGTGRTREQERGKGLVCVSLARYNDKFVEEIEEWEKITRGKSSGKGRERGAEITPSREGGAGELREIFDDKGKWDKGKIVRSFARLGDVEGMPVKEPTNNGPIMVHTLRPLSDKRWQAMQTVIERTEAEQKNREANTLSAASSVVKLGAQVEDEGGSKSDDEDSSDGIILDAEREVRAKLYIGSVFMGWFWFIPTFHMPQPPPSPSAPSSSEPRPSSPSLSTHLTLTRKELDFPLGAGAALLDVDVTLEWVVPRSMGAREPRPPETQTSQDSRQGRGGEPQPGAGPTGIVAAGLQAAISDESGREVVEVVQATGQ